MTDNATSDNATSDNATASSALPNEDQLVTMVSVKEGNIYVSSARALVVKSTTIALKLDSSLSEPPEFTRAQPLTMLYTRGDRVLRLKAVVRERIDAERVTVEPVGDVKEGDRRDYRRADVHARLHASPVNGTDAHAARDAQVATAESVTEDTHPWSTQTINLSGSGLQFTHADAVDAGSLLAVRLELPLPTPTVVSLIGGVVRCAPHGEGDRYTVAVRFAEISEHDQDLVVYTVFSRFFESEGAAEDLQLELD